MNPIYYGQAEYGTRAIGRAKPANLTLFPDHLEVVSKTREPLLMLPLRAIESASYVKGGLIRLRLNGNQLHFITFHTLKWRMLGVFGVWLSGAGKKGTEFANALRSVGVQVQDKVV